MRLLCRSASTVLALAFVVAACSSSDDRGDTAESTSIDTSATAETTGDGPGLVDKSDETDSAAGTGSESTTGDGDSGEQDAATAAPSVVTTVLPTVPEVGVPGIDSADLFCRSWSEFAGTFQALALASSFATENLSAQRSEVAASGAIVAAVAGLDEHLPSELEDEREALTVGLVGPMERRAERASAELSAAGLTPEQIDELSEVWLAALVAAGVDEPDIELNIPTDLESAVEEAVDVFSASVPLISEDPSLVTAASIPMTEGYIVDNCPDQGTLGGNDVIEQP